VVEAKDLPPELQQPVAPRAAAEPVAASAASGPAEAVVVPLHSAPAATPAGEPAPSNGGSPAHWLGDLEREARSLLEAGEPEVWDTLTRKFEGQLIHTALEITRGRRIEAAQKLGIGRNTITRKIQELGLDD